MARLINKFGVKRKSTTTCHLSKRREHLDADMWISGAQSKTLKSCSIHSSSISTHTIFPWETALFEHLNCWILLYRNMQSFLHQQSSIVRVTELHWGSKALDYSCVTAVSSWGDWRIALMVPVSRDRRTSPGFGDCRAQPHLQTRPEGRQSLCEQG